MGASLERPRRARRVWGGLDRARRLWGGLDRAHRVALAGMALLTAGAITVRGWLMFGYGTAFLGFSDSTAYVLAARGNGSVFGPQKPAGYPIFLKIVHLFSDHLGLTILVQHALGIAAGVLLYKAVRRAGAPPYLGLLPAAVVYFGGTGLLLEHSLLGDSLFTFVQAAGVYAAVRALGEQAPRWPLLAGLAIGSSFWVKTVGIASAVLVPLVLLLAAPGTIRQRISSGGTVAAVAASIVLAYVGAQAVSTGYVGYQRQSAWNLYGRVATFVDCSHFTPPAGTRFLCPPEPLSRRGSQNYFQYDGSSPAVRHFGFPGKAPTSANGVLQRFSLAAIEHEPGAYADAILDGLAFFISARPGEGYTPASLREALFGRGGYPISRDFSLYYSHPTAAATTGSIHSLVEYESDTRIQGAAIVVLLLAGILGAPLLRSRMGRSATALFTLTAIFSATLAVAGNSYDARYAYPLFGPLAAGGAVGSWGIAMRVAGLARRVSSRHDGEV